MGSYHSHGDAQYTEGKNGLKSGRLISMLYTWLPGDVIVLLLAPLGATPALGLITVQLLECCL